MASTLYLVVLYSVLLCWLIFGLAIILHRRSRQQEKRKRGRLSILAMGLSGMGFALVWGAQRPPFRGMFPSIPWTEMFLAGVTIVVAAVSVWFVLAGVRSLGEHWSLAPRLIAGHRLVTTGPYAIVRHPIYTGMLGMMVATGLAVSTWLSLSVAMVLGWYGTVLRIRREERLLREAFGDEFEEYARRVPALVPRLPWKNACHRFTRIVQRDEH
jgi:protein-S-isoprenylcysteine O-methyltransferase Ste14